MVWSANDNSPVNSMANLIVTPTGDLSLSNSSGPNLWPSRITGSNKSTILTLQDTGNLVFGAWNSFSIPTNTILPNQAINGSVLTSKNGKYSFSNSTYLIYNGNPSSNYYSMVNAFLELDDQGNVSQGNGRSYISSDFGEQRLRRLTLDDDGNLRLYSYDPIIDQWRIVWRAVDNLCKIHGKCGDNSICVYDIQDYSTSCVCPPGFKQVSADANNCQRKIGITNLGKTKFLKLEYVRFPGGENKTSFQVSNLSMCQAKCKQEPNCLGFFFKYDGNNQCLLQLDMLFYGFWSPYNQGVFFLKVDESETENSRFTGLIRLMETSCPVNISLPQPPEESHTTTRNIALITALFAAELISGTFFFWTFLNKYIKYRDMARTFGLEAMHSGGPKRFSYAELKDATKNFSEEIGKGGFGHVYKGKLTDGRVVAVKCLKNVTGGDTDFWAEVTIIARMHHLNLVRLWGFCTDKGNRILVYEYVPNGSLDKFLFQRHRTDLGRTQPQGTEGLSELSLSSDQEHVLDWNIRYRIALGVARAIAYLHEECLEWVLHCDIKPENILLGEDFCPKVSDFGLSKMKKKDDMISRTHGVRGTRGYMAPEWIRGPVTSKSDVYSFGIVLLELVAGMRTYEHQNSKLESHQFYFPEWAFDKVFNEFNVDDILDPKIKQSYDSRSHFDMVNRMVKTALCCLQARPESRPSMGKVAKMLEGTVEITEPEKPTMFSGNEIRN